MIGKRMLAAGVAMMAMWADATGAFAEPAGDAVRGRHVFRKCAVCHVINPGSTALLAPPLNDVLGRAAATTPGFEYSDIMKLAGQKGLVWTKVALNYFLDRPEQFIPGTYMAFAGLETQERADVIAYLATLTRANSKQAQSEAPPKAAESAPKSADAPAPKPKAKP